MTRDKHLTIVMPKLGLTMTEGTLSRWRKQPGEPVQAGEILFEFESDKSVMEFEVPAAGVLAHIHVAEGETVPCGTPLAELAAGQASLSAVPSSTELQTGFTATPAAKRRARERGVDLSRVVGRGPGGRIHLADVDSAAVPQPAARTRSGTPLAKRRARELGVDWTQLAGSGPGGRVVRADVESAAVSAPEPETATAAEAESPVTPVSIEPLAGVRAVIAQRMSSSAFTAPHVTLFADADATWLVEARRQINAEQAGGVKIGVNTLLVGLAARALREHPALNAALVGNDIHRYRDIHIALAVDTDRGLLTPVIRHADRLSLPEIQRAGDELIGRALAGQSRPDDLSGGTFTVTNLGKFEIDGFTPIINPPQAAILGVGQIAPKAVVIEGQVVAHQMVTLSLSFDHRLVDGGPAARFLQRVKQLIERPFALLAESR